MELKWKYLDELYREKYFDKDVPPVYLKSEADKVIAHNKFKRCMAMAETCHYLTNYGPEETSDFYDKWTYIWQELAEKFKEAK